MPDEKGYMRCTRHDAQVDRRDCPSKTFKECSVQLCSYLCLHTCSTVRICLEGGYSSSDTVVWCGFTLVYCLVPV